LNTELETTEIDIAIAEADGVLRVHVPFTRRVARYRQRVMIGRYAGMLLVIVLWLAMTFITLDRVFTACFVVPLGLLWVAAFVYGLVNPRVAEPYCAASTNITVDSQRLCIERAGMPNEKCFDLAEVRSIRIKRLAFTRVAAVVAHADKRRRLLIAVYDNREAFGPAIDALRRKLKR
jgi:hypothetical protein